MKNNKLEHAWAVHRRNIGGGRLKLIFWGSCDGTLYMHLKFLINVTPVDKSGNFIFLR